MSLILVRHGRTATNAARALQGRVDTSLDAHGTEQAAAVAAALGPVDRIVSSPLQRAKQTAAAIADAQPNTITVEVEPGIIELDYGDLDETPLADVPPELWANWRSDPDFTPPGGESLSALHSRVVDVLDGLANDARDQRIVLVSHVSPIKSAVCWALGAPIETSWRLFLATASVTRIAVSERGASLTAFNEVTPVG